MNYTKRENQISSINYNRNETQIAFMKNKKLFIIDISNILLYDTE